MSNVFIITIVFFLVRIFIAAISSDPFDFLNDFWDELRNIQIWIIYILAWSITVLLLYLALK